MNAPAQLVSKILVLENSADCYDRIKVFCDLNGLVGLKVQGEHVMSVLRSNVDLGGILMSISYSDSESSGIALARRIHAVRPELPIFLRCEKKAAESAGNAAELSAADRKLFACTYLIDDTAGLRAAIETSIFSQVYPNVLVRGITEITRSALESQFKEMSIDVEPPYLVRDRIIFGEIFTLIPIESSWCRGYMMLDAGEEPMLQLVRANRTHANADANGGSDFRNLNNVLGEITNLIWGAFRNRYISYVDSQVSSAQVPIIINHLHRYISFGSDDAQLCFKYTLTDKNDSNALSRTIHQRFIFNLNWSPEDFMENQASIEALFESGELELF